LKSSFQFNLKRPLPNVWHFAAQAAHHKLDLEQRGSIDSGSESENITPRSWQTHGIEKRGDGRLTFMVEKLGKLPS
jgi:hypothetical protein